MHPVMSTIGQGKPKPQSRKDAYAVKWAADFQKVCKGLVTSLRHEAKEPACYKEHVQLIWGPWPRCAPNYKSSQRRTRGHLHLVKHATIKGDHTPVPCGSHDGNFRLKLSQLVGRGSRPIDALDNFHSHMLYIVHDGQINLHAVQQLDSASVSPLSAIYDRTCSKSTNIASSREQHYTSLLSVCVCNAGRCAQFVSTCVGMFEGQVSS